MMRALILLTALIAAPAIAQTAIPRPVNAATVATKSDVQAAAATADAAKAAASDAAAKAAAAQAAIPDLTPYAKTVDLAPLARAADVSTSISTVQSSLMAAMPKRATTLPPTEVVTPTLGTSTAYRGADDPQPRITRAKQCVLVAGGTCTVTYETMSADDPNVIPVSQGTNPIFCAKAAAATRTSASIRCWLYQTAVLSLAVVTTGITLGPQAAPAGTVVDITMLPKN